MRVSVGSQLARLRWMICRTGMWVEGGIVSLNTLFVSNQLLMMFVEV